MQFTLLSHNVVVFIEKYGSYFKVYYANMHCEFVELDINSLHVHDDVQTYKKPIEYFGHRLYPTKNQKEDDCKWINLAYIDEQDKNFIMFLYNKGVLEKTKKMYFKYKEKQLFQI